MLNDATVPLTAPLMREREVAAALAISTRTVRELADAGDLRRVQVRPRATRYRAEDVAALIERQTARRP